VIHYKVIATTHQMGGSLWSTEFDSPVAAAEAAQWLKGQGYDVKVIKDDEDDSGDASQS
jgi:hypothetical protein